MKGLREIHSATWRLFAYFVLISCVYFSLALSPHTIWNKTFALAQSPDGPELLEITPDITRNNVVLNVDIFGVNLNNIYDLRLTQNNRFIVAEDVQIIAPNHVNCNFDFVCVSPGEYDLWIETSSGVSELPKSMLIKGTGHCGGDDDDTTDDDTADDDVADDDVADDDVADDDVADDDVADDDVADDDLADDDLADDDLADDDTGGDDDDTTPAGDDDTGGDDDDTTPAADDDVTDDDTAHDDDVTDDDITDPELPPDDDEDDSMLPNGDDDGDDDDDDDDAEDGDSGGCAC